MLAVWREWGIDELLHNAYHEGKIMSGVSAGAICWFEKGVTDSWDDELRVLDCLGIIKGNCCPHYDEEPDRIPYTNKFLTEGLINSIHCIEGGSALILLMRQLSTMLVFINLRIHIMSQLKTIKY